VTRGDLHRREPSEAHEVRIVVDHGRVETDRDVGDQAIDHCGVDGLDSSLGILFVWR
jgi:hypothetical protein